MSIKDLRILSSIPTNSIDESSKIPLSMGSGCFVKYGNYTFFLTVYHTVDNNKLTSGIVADIDADKGAKLLPLALVPPIKCGNLKSGTMDTVDFSYWQTPQMPPCYYFEADITGTVKKRIRRIAITSNLTDVPNKTEDYGFAGYIYCNITQNPIVDAKFQNILSQELAYYDGLKYKESIDDYHIFSLPNKDYEHDDFKGTSGAPILDSQGRLVALVSRGGPTFDGKEWTIKGINLAKYKFIFDIACGNIK